MRSTSKKKAARDAEAKPFRDQLKREVGHCEICGHDPRHFAWGHTEIAAWPLLVHEIARGAHRQKALDKRFAVLVLCDRCHMERVHRNEDWPEARQLAVLRRSRAEDYDLAAFNELIGWGPDRITEEDVNAWEGE